MLSLAASLAKKKVKGEGGVAGRNLTGVVIDSGDGVTHVIPVVSCDVTSHVVLLQRNPEGMRRNTTFTSLTSLGLLKSSFSQHL